MSSTQRVFFVLLTIAGIALSILTLNQHAALKIDPSSTSAFCSISEHINCAPVINSQFGQLFGIPLGSYGLIFYGALLYLVVLLKPPSPEGELAWRRVLLVLAAASVLASIALFIISEFFIEALCPICLSMYVVNALLLLLAWRALQGEPFAGALGGGCASLVCSPKLLFSTRGQFQFSAFSALISFSLLVVFSTLLPAWLEARAAREFRMGAADSSDLLAIWKRQSSQIIPMELDGDLQRDHYKGNRHAAVTVVEYSDFECPACRGFSLEIASIAREYGERIMVVHKDFPIDKSCNPLIEHEAHQSACYAAIFARCAGEQNRYWEAVEYLFQLSALDDPIDTKIVHDAIDEGAAKLGLDVAAMKQCRDSQRQNEKILSDIRLAESLGLTATPSIWVNGKLLPRPDGQLLRGAINLALSGK